MSGTAVSVIAVLGVATLLLALARASGRRVFITLGGDTLLGLLLVAVLLGHARLIERRLGTGLYGDRRSANDAGSPDDHQARRTPG